MQCILSKLCIETYARSSRTDLTGHHFVFLIFPKIFMLIRASFLSSFIERKYYSFSSVLVGVIFSQVNPGIPQQVAGLIL